MHLDHYQLAALEFASQSPSGTYREGAPPTGLMADIVEAGFMDVIEPEGFFGGTFRINDAGRAFLSMWAAPIGEW